MESRCRGANGEVGGEAGDEYALCGSFLREFRRYWGLNGDILESCPNDAVKFGGGWGEAEQS